MHCTNCGATVTDEWRHCSHCGAALPTEEHRQKAKAAGAGIREGWQSAAPYSTEEIETQRELVSELSGVHQDARKKAQGESAATGCGCGVTVAALLWFGMTPEESDAADAGYFAARICWTLVGALVVGAWAYSQGKADTRRKAVKLAVQAAEDLAAGEDRLASMERQVAAYERAQAKRGS